MNAGLPLTHIARAKNESYWILEDRVPATMGLVIFWAYLVDVGVVRKSYMDQNTTVVEVKT